VYLGIDIGTSGVKALLLDERGAIVAQAADALQVSRPQPGFSEQDPDSWCRRRSTRSRRCPPTRAPRCGPWLERQMHGATLLDRQDRPLRRPSCGTMDARRWSCLEIERASPHRAPSPATS